MLVLDSIGCSKQTHNTHLSIKAVDSKRMVRESHSYQFQVSFILVKVRYKEMEKKALFLKSSLQFCPSACDEKPKGLTPRFLCDSPKPRSLHTPLLSGWRTKAQRG